MERAWQSGAVASPPLHTSLTTGNYPTNSDPGAGVPATQPGAFWFHMITEELRAVLAAAGVTPDKSVLTQLLTALTNAGLTVNGWKFPATQVPSAGANTLDDYDEVASWDPVIGGNGGTSGQTYAAQDGVAIKVGRIVVAAGRAKLSAKGTITGSVEIQGVPFQAAVARGACLISPDILATNWYSLHGLIETSGARISLAGFSAAAVSPTQLTTSDISNDTDLRFVAVFVTAD